MLTDEGMRPHVTVREERGVTEGGTAARPVVAVRIMMIRIQQKSDEGHGDYIRDESDDNDDVPSAFIAPSPSAMKTFQLHLNVISR